MNFDDFRRRADAVRDVPLETVLLLRGASRDPRDRSKWQTEQGPLSVTGPRFMNWHCGRGGGGAIDLVMHLGDVDVCTAVSWLEEHVAAGHLSVTSHNTASDVDDDVGHTSQQKRRVPEGGPTLRLPAPEPRMLKRVRDYLTGRRRLAASALEPLVESGRLYADHRGNAVFLLVVGRPNRPIGAELRGTGRRVWHGMAPGTRKELGYFWIGTKGCTEIVLCESAIDAISCYQMQPQRICLSTSGVRPNPRWLRGLLVRDYKLYCGFDADNAGDAAANQMIRLHPRVQRLRPPAHDWNDALAASS